MKQDEAVPMLIAKELLEGRAAATDPVRQEVGRHFRELGKAGKIEEGFKEAMTAPVDATKANENIEQFGYKRDKDGKKIRDKGEQKRYDTAVKEQERIIKLLEKGYDKLSPSDRKILKGAVKAKLMSSPTMRSAILQLDAEGKSEDFLRRILRESDYPNSLRARLEAHFENDALNDQALFDSENSFINAKQQRDTAREVHEETRKKLEAAKRTKKSFEDKTKGRGKQLSEYNASRKKDDQDRQTLENQKQALTAKEQGLKNKLRNYPADATAQTELNTTLQDQSRLELQIQQSRAYKREQLEKMRDDADSQIQALTPQVRETRNQWEKAEAVYRREKGKFHDAKKKRTAEEAKRVRELEMMVGEATGDWLNDQVEIATERNQLICQKRAEEAKKLEDEKQANFIADFERNLQNRWDSSKEEGFGIGPFKLGKREVSVPDRVKVKPDYQLLQKYGVKAVVVQVGLDVRRGELALPSGYASVTDLIDRNPQEFDKLYNKMKTDYHLTDEQIGNLDKNTGTQLLFRKIATGGIPKADVQKFVNTKWGESMLTDALAKNTHFNEMVKNLSKEHGLQGGVLGKAKELLSRHPWMWLLLFGVGAVALAGVQQAREDQKAV